MKTTATMAAAMVFLTACTAVQVKPVDASLGMTHVCIQENPKVTVPDFVTVLRDGLDRNGLSSEIHSGALPAHCEYVMTYTALRSWDMGTYLSHAELRIDRAGRQVASAQYHLRGKGGLALNKWKSVKSKMDPVIDELLAGHRRAPSAVRGPAPEQTAQTVPAPAAAVASAAASVDTVPAGARPSAVALPYQQDPEPVARTLAGMRNCVGGFTLHSRDDDRHVYSATCWGSKKLLVSCQQGICREME
jgi:hypothetical protein